MKTVFTLTSAESRRLIAKAVVAMPEFKKAWESAYLLLAGGTTNAFIAQELLGRDGIEPDAALSASAPMGCSASPIPTAARAFRTCFTRAKNPTRRWSRRWLISTPRR